MSDLILETKYTIKYKINNLNIIDYIYNLNTNKHDEIKKEIAALTGADINNIEILDIQEQ